MAKWAAVDFGAQPRTILWRSFRAAARREGAVLTTADVLAMAGKLGAGLPRGIVGGRKTRHAEDWAPTPAAVAEDGGLDPAGFGGRAALTASVMALRESRWRGSRQARSSPQWSRALTAAMDYALGDVRSRGLSYVSDVHLVLGLLADRGNGASRLLARTGINRRDLVLRLRRSREVKVSGEAWTPLVDALEAFGVLRGPDLPTRAVGLVGRQAARLGGHGHPLLAVLPQEISRQAVLLGDAEVSTAHLVLAAVALGNTAGAVLAEHGFRAGQELRSAGLPTEAFEPVAADVARRIWPALRNGDPVWGRRVVDLLSAARADAAARGPRGGGTTHLLAVTLAEPDSAAVRWLDALGVKVGAVRADLERDLG